MSTKRGTFLLLPILFSIIIPFNLAFSQDLTCTEIGSAVDMANAYALPVVDEPFNFGSCITARYIAAGNYPTPSYDKTYYRFTAQNGAVFFVSLTPPVSLNRKAFQVLNDLGPENVTTIQEYDGENIRFASAGFNEIGQTV